MQKLSNFSAIIINFSWKNRAHAQYWMIPKNIYNQPFWKVKFLNKFRANFRKMLRKIKKNFAKFLKNLPVFLPWFAHLWIIDKWEKLLILIENSNHYFLLLKQWGELWSVWPHIGWIYMTFNSGLFWDWKAQQYLMTQIQRSFIVCVLQNDMPVNHAFVVK